MRPLQEKSAMAPSSVIRRHRAGADHADLQDLVAHLHLAPIDGEVTHDLSGLAGDQDAVRYAVKGIVVAVRRGAFGKRFPAQLLNPCFKIAREGVPVDLDPLRVAQIGVSASRRLSLETCINPPNGRPSSRMR